MLWTFIHNFLTNSSVRRTDQQTKKLINYHLRAKTYSSRISGVCSGRLGTRIWRAREREPITMVWGHSLSGVQGKAPSGVQSPWSWRQFYYTINNSCGWSLDVKFLRESAMLKHVLAIGWTSVCLSVRQSVTRWYCIKMLSCLLHRTIAHSF